MVDTSDSEDTDENFLPLLLFELTVGGCTFEVDCLLLFLHSCTILLLQYL